MAKRLLILNGLATLSLPLHHAAAYGFSAMFQWTDRYAPVTVPDYEGLGSLAFYGLLVVRQLAAFAIPAFLFVSGFFVAFAARSDNKNENKWAPMLARVRKLVVPFVLWTTLVFILLRKIPSPDEALRMYYFIILLAQYYLISPLMTPLARNRWKELLIAAAVVQFGLQGLRYATILGASSPTIDFLIRATPIWLFPSRIFYFSLGVVAGFHLESMRHWLARFRWAVLAVLLLAAPLMIIEYQFVASVSGNDWLGPSFTGVSRILYAITVPMALLAFDRFRLPLESALSGLGGKSLGIYLVNTPAIYLFALILYRQVPWVLGEQLLYQLGLILVGLAVPLLTMEVIRRSPARVWYRYAFG